MTRSILIGIGGGLLALLALVPVSASAQTGDFVNAEPVFSSPAGIGVLRGPANHPTLGQIGANQIGVDRSGDGLLDEIYDIPGEILFNSAGNTIQFRLSPSQDALYSRRFNINGAPVCAGRNDSNLIYFHQLGTAPATTSLASGICLDGPIAIGPVFMDDPAAVRRTAVIAASPANNRQSVAWVDLADGGYNVDGLGYRPNVLNSPNGIQFAPDGRAAFVDSGAGSSFRRFSMIDLCRSPVASASAVSSGSLASGLARGQVVSGGGGDLLAELRLDGAPLPATQIVLDDCSGIQPPSEYNLIVEKSGNGEGVVSSVPSGINCGAACQRFFNDGTVVSLTAVASFSSTFNGWSGDCSGTSDTVQVTMDGQRSCVANFTQPESDIKAVIGAVPLPVTAGLNIALTLAVANDGPDPVNASLGLPPVDGLTLLSENSSDCLISQQRVFCSFNGIAPGQSGTVQVQANVDPATRGSLDLDLTASTFQFDPDLTNDSISMSLPVVASADLVVQMTAEPDPVPAGETLVYRIDVSNLGPSTATDIDVQYVLPTGVTLLDSQAASCTAGEVTPDGESTITLMGAVDPGLAAGTALNASAQVNALEPDPVGSNNTAFANVNVGAALPTTPPAPFSRIIEQGDPDPNGNDILRSFINASWRGETIAFYADNRGQPPGNYHQGIYRVRNGRVVTIADSDTLIPGSTDPLQFVSPIDARISERGRAAFEMYEDRGCGLSRVLANDVSRYEVVAIHGDQLVLETRFDGFMGDALQLWDGNNLQKIVDQMTILPGQSGPTGNGFGLSVALLDGDVAFWANADEQGIYLKRAGQSVQIIANEDTPIPGGSGTFAGFDFSFDAVSMDASGIAFRGYNSQGVPEDVGNRGIYFYDRQANNLQRVADTSTPIPGGSGNFAYFGEAFPSTSTANNPATENGAVVFFGSGDASNASGGGLYIWRNGTITPLVEQGDIIDGLPGQIFSASSRSLSNGRLVFIAARGPTPGQANQTGIYTLEIDNGLIFASGFEGN